jgi:hypothetical protein
MVIIQALSLSDWQTSIALILNPFSRAGDPVHTRLACPLNPLILGNFEWFGSLSIGG